MELKLYSLKTSFSPSYEWRRMVVRRAYEKYLRQDTVHIVTSENAGDRARAWFARVKAELIADHGFDDRSVDQVLEEVDQYYFIG